MNFNFQTLIMDILEDEVHLIKSEKYQKNGPFKDYREFNFKIKNQIKYNQVFMERNGFIANLSIIDLLFNLGPDAYNYLHNLDINQ